MPLDPQAQALLEQMQALGAPPLHEQPVEMARESLAMFASMGGTGEEVAKTEDRGISAPHGEIPVRIYTPHGSGPFPVIVFFHGGGWVLGDLETHDITCRALANGAKAVVVAVHYRLAPEHKFPAAADDCYAALQWAHEHAAELGGDPSRMAVAGDSAGGNLAAVTALKARDEGGPALRFQLLVYPVTDFSMATPSYEANAEGYVLTKDSMKWFWDHYCSDADRKNPYASPLHAPDVSGLPPALVITAEFDPLRDEGEAYAKRLEEAGVAVKATRYDGQVHGFFGMTAIFDAAKRALDEATSALREALK